MHRKARRASAKNASMARLRQLDPQHRMALLREPQHVAALAAERYEHLAPRCTSSDGQCSSQPRVEFGLMETDLIACASVPARTLGPSSISRRAAAIARIAHAEQIRRRTRITELASPRPRPHGNGTNVWPRLCRIFSVSGEMPHGS